MSKMKNYMMDIEEFCDGYFYGGDVDFTIDEVVEDVGMYFKYDTMAKEYAKEYLTKTLGEM
jgi:hypothetical protein